jgi:protein-tyrosine-phosphatase
MQPYQTASEEINRQAQAPLKTLKKVGSLIGGAAIAGRILPFLSKHIPGELMRKGLSKIEPRLGKFVEGAINNGYDIEEVRNFMSEKFSPKEQEEPQENPIAKQAKDFETNYPDIIQALMSHINNGQSPEAAAAILKQSTPFSQKIKKIEKETGKNFVDFILEMMGGNQSSQMQQPQQMQAQALEGTPETPIQQAQPSQQQGGGGLDPQLMQLMNGIRSSIQNLRGGNG